MGHRLDAARRDAHSWRARRESDVFSDKDEQDFRRWMAEHPAHAEAFAEAEVVWMSLGEAEFSADILEIDAPKKTGGLWSNTFSGPAWGARLAGGAAVFASLALVFVTAQFFTSEPTGPVAVEAPPTALVLSNSASTPSEYELADGSTLTLGIGSNAEVLFDSTQRSVYLDRGEALFEVASLPDRPFVVTTGGAEIRVTGTMFELRRRHDAVTVGVVEGEVEVSHALALSGVVDETASQDWSRQEGTLMSRTRLQSGERVRVSRSEGLGEPFTAEAGQIGAWRSGTLIYLETPLSDVISDLNRYAGSSITLDPAAAGLTLSGTFDVSEIHQLPEILPLALPVEIDTTGDTERIVLRK